MMHISGAVNKATREALRKVREDLASLNGGALGKRLVKDVGELEVKQAIKHFATEGQEGGSPWKSLADENKGYAKWKQRNWPGKKLLVWTGEKIRKPVTQMSDPDHIARLDGGVLEFGTKSELAVKHHRGEKFGTWQAAHLKEKTPQFPKGSKWRQKRGASGRFASGRERHLKGKAVAGRNWFTFWYRSIPARPVVRKSQEQSQQIKLAISRTMLTSLAQAAGSRTLMGREFAKAAGQINVKA